MTSSRSYPGRLIAFEGPERGLRLRAIEAVRNVLEAQGHPVVVTRWMSSALAGEVYRESAPLFELSPRTLALLAACDIAERLEWDILPALEAGAVVLADRYLYRVVLGTARDVDPDWLEVLCGSAPLPDAVLHFAVPLQVLVQKLDPLQLDLYEAGMDIGMTHDLPLSFRLYQERLLEGYADWSQRHAIPIEEIASIEAAEERVLALLGLADAPLDRRRLGVLHLLEESGADPVHSRQVARLARQLFEQSRSLHQLGEPELALLEQACLLHDVSVGSFIEEHPVRSARQVRESGLAEFDQTELDAIAVLIGIHRAVEEQSEVETWLRGLPGSLQRTVQLLGPLLRLAEGLDATRRQTVRSLTATIHDGLFDVLLRATSKAKPELRAAVQRADLFEQTYGLHLAIEVDRKGPPPAGAHLVAPGARPWHER